MQRIVPPMLWDGTSENQSSGDEFLTLSRETVKLLVSRGGGPDASAILPAETRLYPLGSSRKPKPLHFRHRIDGLRREHRSRGRVGAAST